MVNFLVCVTITWIKTALRTFLKVSRVSHRFSQNLHEDKRTLATGVSVNILQKDQINFIKSYSTVNGSVKQVEYKSIVLNGLCQLRLEIGQFLSEVKLVDARFWWHLAVHEPARSNQKSAPACSESLFDMYWRCFILNKEKSPNVVVCWHWHFTLSFVFGQSWRGLGKRITWFFKPFLFFC